MLKSKKLFILFMVICCICVLSGCGAAARISRFYGVYVCTTDKESIIEFTDFDIPRRTGIINYKNVSFPTNNIEGYSQMGARVKVFKRKKRSLIFSTVINGQELIGSLDVDKKKVDLGGRIYIKREL